MSRGRSGPLSGPAPYPHDQYLVQSPTNASSVLPTRPLSHPTPYQHVHCLVQPPTPHVPSHVQPPYHHVQYRAQLPTHASSVVSTRPLSCPHGRGARPQRYGEVMSLPVLLLPCAVAAWRVWRRHAHAAAPRRPPSSSLTACRRVPPRRPPRSSSIPACCCVAPWRRRGFPRRASVRLGGRFTVERSEFLACRERQLPTRKGEGWEIPPALPNLLLHRPALPRGRLASRESHPPAPKEVDSA